MLTEEGIGAILDLLVSYAGQAMLRVSNGSSAAEAQLDNGFPRVENGVVVLQATFGPEAANFEWLTRSVVVGGKVIDTIAEDAGTKTQGSIWTLQHELEPVALDGN